MRTYGSGRATLKLKRGSCNPTTFEITEWDAEEKDQLMFKTVDGIFVSYPLRNISWYTVQYHSDDTVRDESSQDNGNTIER